MSLKALICVILYPYRVVFYSTQPDSNLYLTAWTKKEINIFITLKDQICSLFFFFKWNIKPEFSLSPPTIFTILIPRKENSPLLFHNKDQEPLWSGVTVVRLPSCPFQWQFTGTHHTRGSPRGGNSTQPPCVTGAPPSHHPSGTLTQRWQSAPCDVVPGPVYPSENPLKVALNGKRTKRPRCYYRSTLVGVLIWWVWDSGSALLWGTTAGLHCLLWPEGSFLIFVAIRNLQQPETPRLLLATCKFLVDAGFS